MIIRVGIFLFDEAEALDFAGPYEVFTTASRVALRPSFQQTQEPQATLFSVVSVAAHADLVKLRAGMRVLPDVTFADATAFDVLIVPGGVVSQEMQKPAVIQWIANTAEHTQITASVCTGAFLLAKAGVLTDHTVTTHWEDIPDLRLQFPDLEVQDNVRWVDQGKIVTSAGISAGIDMSLHLVERLAGRELAIATARQMEFEWQQT
ncbi:MAG: DJ-1/PfpI family protein [Pseudohongiella sp.]|nr:DJ-1/PfpI family protein [Pseudohongiella sp.]